MNDCLRLIYRVEEMSVNTNSRPTVIKLCFPLGRQSVINKRNSRVERQELMYFRLCLFIDQNCLEQGVLRMAKVHRTRVETERCGLYLSGLVCTKFMWTVAVMSSKSFSIALLTAPASYLRAPGFISLRRDRLILTWCFLCVFSVLLGVCRDGTLNYTNTPLIPWSFPTIHFAM